MRTRTLTVYNCDHCNKLYQKEKACALHEKMCSKNPDNNRACFSCIHLEKRKQILYKDRFDGGEDEIVVEAFWCRAKEHALYPPKTEALGNPFEFGDYLNEPMPLVCAQSSSNNIHIR